jgi:hypothetical protein
LLVIVSRLRQRDPWRTGAVVVALALLVAVAAGCGGSKPPSVASLTRTSSTARSKAAASAKRPSRAALAACFRAHGFPAAIGSAANTSSTAISIFGVVISGADPSSPRFQQTMQACRRYLPGGGPPSLSPAQRATWAKSMAKFAACMRKSGVPDFPDPGPGGTPFPASAIAKIGPTSPRVAKAFKACEPLEPNVGPHITFG